MNNFRVEINTEFKDNNRNFTIIDRKINEFKKGINFKFYKYHCNKCGAELWIQENHLLRGVGCGCCTNRRAVKGINDISTTNPELIKYFVNIEDCYTHTKCSHKRVLLKCPQCGYEKEMIIHNLYKNGFSCSQCCDGISYPEKFMFNLLKQLRVDFIYQYSKTNSKWCNKYRYDFNFNLNNEEYIIETHGEQHYEEGFSRYGGQTLEQIQENDKNKYNLAIENGIKPENYIVIDCRKSDLEFIKNNIINSKLNEIFNLDNIDWNKIGQESEKTR